MLSGLGCCWLNVLCGCVINMVNWLWFSLFDRYYLRGLFSGWVGFGVFGLCCVGLL